MIVGPMSNQQNVLKMGDALSSCYGITSSDPIMLITWLQKQKLSLDRLVILEKERSGPEKSTCKFMLNNMQCSMA
jgi:predicted transcriptional regulator